MQTAVSSKEQSRINETAHTPRVVRSGRKNDEGPAPIRVQEESQAEQRAPSSKINPKKMQCVL